MERRYRALRTLSTVYRVFAWIALVLGILAGLAILTLGVIGIGGRLFATYGGRLTLGDVILSTVSQGGLIAGIVGFLVALLTSGFYFLLLYAVSELILVALSVEENTRETAYYLRGEGSLSTPIDTGVPLNS